VNYENLNKMGKIKFYPQINTDARMQIAAIVYKNPAAAVVSSKKLSDILLNFNFAQI
jgi:hypothetical protein